MWIITIHRDKSESRDFHISSLLDDTPKYEYYLGKYPSATKWARGESIHFAKVFKRLSAAQSLINKFNSDNKSSYSSPFNWIRDYYLSVRPLKREEWQQIIDAKISKLDRSYQLSKAKLLKLREKF